MAEAAVSTAVQMLGNLLIEKVKSLGAVGGEVEWLKAELQRMQCFLEDAEEKQATDQRVRNWISDIRKVAFDAEDVIEIFILNVENPKKSTGLLERCACFPNHFYLLDQVAEEIHSIRRRLEAIKQSRETYGVKDLGVGVDWTQIPNHVEWQRRLIPTQKDKDVVGLENDMQTLLERAILDDTESLSSATIVGMPGIGKSTLARVVYNHNTVVERFEKRAWVVVSNDFRPSQIFKDLILELLEPSERRSEMLETIKHEEAPKLQQMLYERLQSKRYLIVLDDVWEDAHITSLASVFPNEGNGSRLLITSRSRIWINYTRHTHLMQILEFDESWELFLKKALTDSNEVKCPEDLEELGREIVKNCDGLPLAINTVGGLLRKQGQSKSGWAKVLNGINSYLGRNGSVVFGILELSYQNLPPELKSCFLCLAFFKEDAIVRAQKLKNIWITQGFIRPEGEETVEATTTRYLDELVNRNLIQVKDIYPAGDQINKFQVHDLIRELSISKAKEEMGLEVSSDEGSSQSSDTPRHRALYNNDDDNSRNKHVRSLFIYTDGKLTPSYWKTFELLKLLDLEGFGSLREVSEAIGALIGLKYLGLKRTGIEKLPRSFRKLINLEVIELPRHVALPSCAWKFVNLRHIDARVEWRDVPHRTSNLKNIRVLKCLFIAQSDLEQLAPMANLSYLTICICHLTDLSSLAVLKNLLRLSLHSHTSGSLKGLDALRHVTRLKILGKITGLPTDFPPNVCQLTLKYNSLEEDPMPLLEKLPSLSYLYLHNAYNGQNMVISSNGFPRLQILNFDSMANLSSARIGEGAMPQLKRVIINSCPFLSQSFPSDN